MGSKMGRNLNQKIKAKWVYNNITIGSKMGRKFEQKKKAKWV